MYLQYKQVQLAVGLYCGLRSEWGWLSLCSSKEQQYYCLQYVRYIWVNYNADMKKRLPLFYFLRLFYLVCASSLIIYQFESVSFTLNLTHWKAKFYSHTSNTLRRRLQSWLRFPNQTKIFTHQLLFAQEMGINNFLNKTVLY